MTKLETVAKATAKQKNTYYPQLTVEEAFQVEISLKELGLNTEIGFKDKKYHAKVLYNSSQDMIVKKRISFDNFKVAITPSLKTNFKFWEWCGEINHGNFQMYKSFKELYNGK